MSIRLAKAADIPAILSVYSPYVENTACSFEYTTPTLEEFTQRFEAVTAQFPWLVWEEAGQVLGYAYGSAPFTRAAYRWCASVSVYLAPELQGRGVGRQLYVALEALLTKQGYQLLYAIVTSENTGSLEFHRKLGFCVRGVLPDCGFKQGAWHGITWLEKRLKSVETPSAFPCQIADIVESDRNFV